MFADFDSKTVWLDALPDAFKPDEIRELGENPGFDSRTLHLRGITGKGIGIAIIDQTLLVNHQEYSDRVRLYEEINFDEDWDGYTHGCAVASIASGETVGIVNEAELYFMAVNFQRMVGNTPILDYNYIARAIDRLVKINKDLPEEHRIRVTSVARGGELGYLGYAEVEASVRKAMEQGILFVNSNLDRYYEYPFHGLGRQPLNDPDNFMAYEAGLFWQNFLTNDQDRILIPMDSRRQRVQRGLTITFFIEPEVGVGQFHIS